MFAPSSFSGSPLGTGDIVSLAVATSKAKEFSGKCKRPSRDIEQTQKPSMFIEFNFIDERSQAGQVAGKS